MHNKENEMPNKLREIRQAQGVPFLGLAVRARVSTATLSMIERFDYIPRGELQRRLADVLGVPIDTIWPELVLEKEVYDAQR
jgi:transcriptional regulator with XRE-family HTH domain